MQMNYYINEVYMKKLNNKIGQGLHSYTVTA